MKRAKTASFQGLEAQTLLVNFAEYLDLVHDVETYPIKAPSVTGDSRCDKNTTSYMDDIADDTYGMSAEEDNTQPDGDYIPPTTEDVLYEDYNPEQLKEKS